MSLSKSRLYERKVKRNQSSRGGNEVTQRNPTTVDATGQTPGVIQIPSRIDHAHQLANPITRSTSGTLSGLRVRADTVNSQIELVGFLDNAQKRGYRFLDGTGLAGGGQILSVIQQTGDTALLPAFVCETFTGAVTVGALSLTVQALVTYDPSNQLGNGVNSLLLGDDGTIAGATGNLKLFGTTVTATGGFQGATKTKAGLPVAADIPAGSWAVYKDTTGGSIRLWANDGGVMKSVALA